MTKTPWQVHPRPQQKRKLWHNLNGEWLLNGKALTVPFPPQSKLSDYEGDVPEQFLCEKRFTLPADFQKETVLLHFGAVDQIAEVSLNDQPLGRHEGGYLSFSFDISNCVKRDGENLLKVCVTDRLDQTYPYGKQTKKPGGMWYTPVSGIWQTVWLENVPKKHISSVKLDCDLNGVTVTVDGVDSFTAEVDGKTYEFSGKSGRIDMENPIHWTPDDPQLYPLILRSGEDEVESYFALREIKIEKYSGVSRVLLNGKPIFLHGVLDQGYYQDGIFLPHEPEEYDRDILRMKDLGFNLLRKHIKIEPDYFYYACDKFGMLVMQDMVNSGSYNFILDTAFPTIGLLKRPDNLAPAHSKRKDFFRQHMLDTLKHLHNHPSVIAYTIFNEGWGQFNSDDMYHLAKTADPSRLYDSTSGWFAQKCSDFDSPHIYFRSKKLNPRNRPLLLSECGGFAMAVEGHRFNPKKKYGYGTCQNSVELTERIMALYEKMIFPAIPDGCGGCIYTQLSDVEEEINGLYTYDRQVCKVEKEELRILSQSIARTMRAL